MLLERYYLTHLPFTYIPVTAWMEIEGFISHCQIQDVPPLVRLTLLSDGSLVRSLRALYLSDITVDVQDQRQVSMGIEMAKYLDCTEGRNAIVRDAWLCMDGRKLVYAHSFIDSSKIGEVIQKGINKKSMPVGMLLSDYNLPLIRDQLFITQLKSDCLAEEFGVTENIFWARHYRLRGGDGFNAAILEIFSPDMFDSRKALGPEGHIERSEKT